MNKEKPYLGIIGGSGIYDLDNISEAKWQSVSSAFGDPSDKILTGMIVRFLVYLTKYRF